MVLLEEQANIWGTMVKEIIHNMLTQDANKLQISIIENFEQLMACILKSSPDANIELSNSVEHLQRDIFEMNSLCSALNVSLQCTENDFS